MPARIVTIAQQKGGAGKTTVAVQLGVAWAAAGLRLAMVDIDPQRSLAAWHGERRAALGNRVGPHLSDIPGWKLATELDRLRRDFDAIIVDSPPHAETDARAAIRAAALVLVPVQPSPMDLWATHPTLELARKERVPALLVLNRMPARGRLPGQIRARIVADGLPLAAASLGNRLAYAASMMEGRGVAETAPRDPAAAEVAALAAELAAAVGLALPEAVR